MLMVVLLHVLKQGGILDSLIVFTLKYEVAWYLEIACLCAVNCYAIISGYVGVYSKHKYSNLIMLWLRVLFYSILITVAFFIIAPATVGKTSTVSALFPTFTNQYWYFSSYVILFFLMPVLNSAFSILSKRQLKWILVITICTTSIILPLFQTFFVDPFKLENGYSVLWLIIMYLLGGYIRKFGLFHSVKTWLLLVFYIVSVSLTWLSKLLIQLVTQWIFDEIKWNQMWVSYISITVVASSVFLVLFFERLKINQLGSRVVSFVAPLAFSVFLIHTHPLLFEFFKDCFSWVINYPIYVMIPLIIGFALAIFIVCCFIDLFREWLFKTIKLKDRLLKKELQIINNGNKEKLS